MSSPAATEAHLDSTGATPEDARFVGLGIGLVLLFFAVDSVLRTGYFHLGARAGGSARPFLDSFLSEVTGSLATLVVFFAVVVPASRRWPLRGPLWRRGVPFHLGALVAFSVAKTSLMWGMRWATWPLAGLGAYDYGELGYRFAMEGSNDVFGYVLLVAAVHLWDGWKSGRDRELREARLEARLSEARLEALQGQLQPHFLFNTLNTISSVMYGDPETADRLLSRLSDLLRSTLQAPERPEVSVEEELDLLARYGEIMEARFGDRLSLSVALDFGARGARVPFFLLQPLVENAIHHGVASRAGPGTVEVRVERRGARLHVRVDDDGPGIAGDPASAVGTGIGLGNTRERLRHLYGEGATLTLENRPSGGLRVTVELPYRRANEIPAAADATTTAGLEGARA